MLVKKIIHLFFLLSISKFSFCQIPVREEPRHHVVLQNQYLRLLDVRIPPGDTTMFHVHEIPSLFIVLSKTLTASQVKGENWVNGTFTSEPGYAWYNSFTNGPLIHRVANTDAVPFHVMDIEILSNSNKQNVTPLSFDTIFTNEKAYAYHVELSNTKEKKQIENRGAIALIVVSGAGVTVHQNNKRQNVSQGEFAFIEPKTKWWFENNGDDKTNIVLFELR